MKKDGKTGQMEADLSDSSTKKSIAIAKETRETQMKFYNRFLEMFKKEDTEDL